MCYGFDDVNKLTQPAPVGGDRQLLPSMFRCPASNLGSGADFGSGSGSGFGFGSGSGFASASSALDDQDANADLACSAVSAAPTLILATSPVM